MINFRDGEIKDILPCNLSTPETQAVSFAVGEAMRRFQRFSRTSHLYAEIERIPEPVLDLMAVEANTQYYSQSLPRKMKERLITQTLVWYMHAGTPSVLDEFLATVLAGGYIEEWYQYSGSPYHFKAYARAYEDGIIQLGYGTEIKRQLNVYKNTRSYLESLAFILATEIYAEIQYNNQLHIRSDYFARNNRAFLLLDGSWILDGSYKLNGYKTVNLDLYPTRMRVRGAWHTNCAAKAELKYRAGIPMDTKILNKVRQASAFFAGVAEASKARVKSTLRAPTETGGKLRVENNLWYLDGTYLLDGTMLLNAEIFEYDL